VIAAIIALAAMTTQGLPDWENPDVFGINKLPPRADSIPFGSVQSALRGKREDSEFYKSLNGKWKFNWVGKPADRPQNFFEPDFDDTTWQTITVPSCWETQGHGIPIYSNIRYPHGANPPFIPHDYNLVGSYRTKFTVPANWKGRKTTIRFNGVYSAFYLWLNGKKVGYSEDSKGPAEFDLTPHIKDGENLLAVEVYRWCDGSYLEDQDMFRFGGIFRDVSLLSMPAMQIADFSVTPEFRDGYQTAALRIKTKVSNLSEKNQGYELTLDLYDSKGEKQQLATLSAGSLQAGIASQPIVLGPVRNPKLWSNENPYLYRLLLTLKDGNGKVLDIRTTRVGLRDIKIENGVFKVNGVPIKIKGVNRHEAHPDTGRTLTRDQMREDALIMKRFNINTVRCSHYPNDEYWYEICDELGIFVIDEANIESHGMGYSMERSLGNNPVWLEQHLDRTRRMVETHKNHPSIIMWSLGNEAGPGSNFTATSKLVKELDSSRPVHYERYNEVADVDSVMYPGVDYVLQQGRIESEKPFFLCEYAHAMGNAVGNLKEYVDAFYSSDRNLGGCIWDFVDQALRKPDGNGGWYYAYGGDFDDHPNDGPFCNNGIIMPDRQIMPKTWEVKKVYQPIHITEENLMDGQIRIRNRHFFTNLSQFAADWHVSEDGKVVATGKIDDLETAPATEEIIRIRLPDTLPAPGAERFLRISFKLKQDTDWAGRGHEIAWEQFNLPGGVEPEVAPLAGTLDINQKSETVEFTGDGFSAIFSNSTGMLTSYKVDGKEILSFSPRLNIFRAFVDNDVWFQKQFWDSGLGTLQHHSVTAYADQLSDSAARFTAVLQVRGFKGSGFDQTTQYTILADGNIVVDSEFTPVGSLPPLPKIGLLLGVAGEFDNFSWLGRGPFESYPDRKHAADISFYQGKVAEQYQQYVRPQENGNKEEVRWGALTNEQGDGLMFQAGGPLSMTVSKYLPQQLDDARHENGEPRKFIPLIPRSDVVVCLDAKQMGLGGASCGPAPLEQFVCKPERTQFRVIIKPVRNSDDLRKLGRLRSPVPNVPTIVRGDDGLVTVSGDERLTIEIDGANVDPARPVELALGGFVRAYSVGQVEGPVAARHFEKIIAVSKIQLTSAYASSEEKMEGEAAFAVDGDPSTYWHTQYSGSTPKHPHSLTLVFDSPHSVIGFDYISRQTNGNGRIGEYEIQFSNDGEVFKPFMRGRFAATTERQRILFEEPVENAAAMRIVALSELNGGPWASIAEIAFLGEPK
jgi:beta-galactosidase